MAFEEKSRPQPAGEQAPAPVSGPFLTPSTGTLRPRLRPASTATSAGEANAEGVA
jgi:hypothetical protein